MYDQQPHLFAWSDITTDAFDRRLTSPSGDLELDSPMWDWQLETLYLAGIAATHAGSSWWAVAGPTGFEPAISSVTGWHVWPLHHGPAGVPWQGSTGP